MARRSEGEALITAVLWSRDRCPQVAACDGLLTAIRPGRVSSASATRISHVPGRQSGSLPMNRRYLRQNDGR